MLAHGMRPASVIRRNGGKRDEPTRLLSSGVAHRDRDHRRRRHDDLPEDPDRARQNQRAVDAGQHQHVRSGGSGRRGAARLQGGAPLRRWSGEPGVGDGLPAAQAGGGNGGHHRHDRRRRRSVQYDNDVHAGFGAIRPPRAEYGQCEHGRAVHRQRGGEHGLARDQYSRQGGAGMKPNVKQEQGFTLIEVIIAVLVLTVGLLGLVRSAALVARMVALVLLGMISAAVYQVLVSDQRIYQAQTQKIDLQQNIRAAVTILPAEFRVLDASDGDIYGMGPDSIKIRAMRVFGVVCDTPVLGGALGNRGVTVRDALTFGSRAFTPASDSLLIYYEGNPGTRNDDGWVSGNLIGTAAALCVGDLRPGTKLTTNLKPFLLPKQNLPGAIPLGAPGWAFEVDTYRVYQAPDGQWYLGLRPAGGAIQPLVGPLIGANGMTLSYFDAAGAVTAVATSVAQIEIRVRGQTAQPIRLADGRQMNQVDSIVTRVALRNNKRW